MSLCTCMCLVMGFKLSVRIIIKYIILQTNIFWHLLIYISNKDKATHLGLAKGAKCPHKGFKINKFNTQIFDEDLLKS